jgi:hypothetical protein
MAITAEWDVNAAWRNVLRREHIVEYMDCPRGSIYSLPDGQIVCHPRDRGLAERVLADRSRRPNAKTPPEQGFSGKSGDGGN